MARASRAEVRARIDAANGRRSAETEPARALDEAVLLEERRLDAARLTRVVSGAAALWLLAIVPDLVAAQRALHVDAWALVVVRVFAITPTVLTLLWLRAHAGVVLGDRALVALRVVTFAGPALGSAAMAAALPALRVPLSHGLLVVLAVHGAACPAPFRRALPSLGVIVLAMPMALGVGAAIDDELARVWIDPAERAHTTQSLSSIFATAALVAAAGQIDFAMRRTALIAHHRSRYRLDALIGRGGMGEVWRAHHPGLGRDVAIKLLRTSTDSALVARFRREIEATARLAHPNTVRVLDCGVTDDGLLYYTMELLEGATLARLIAAKGALPPERAAFIVRDAARAVGEAHASGLVHRDLKPENLFLTTQGGEHDFVKVLDFGIARLLDDAGASLTHAGAVVGTPRFMAPEQVRGEAGPASDVYALGLVLYAALTGVVPLDDLTQAERIAAREAGAFVPPSGLCADVPHALDAVVMRCLAAAPEARFADANELARALDATGLPARWAPSPLEPLDLERARAAPAEPVRRDAAARGAEGPTLPARAARAKEASSR